MVMKKIIDIQSEVIMDLAVRLKNMAIANNDVFSMKSYHDGMKFAQQKSLEAMKIKEKA